MTDDQEQKVAELVSATERLTEQVATLSVALQTVNHLQQRQLETDRRVNKVAEDSVSKETFEESVSNVTTATALARLVAQRKLRVFAIGTSCIALLIALCAVGFAFKVNRERLDESQRFRAQACTEANAQRVVQAARTRTYFAPKLAAERANRHPDSVLVAILAQLANTQPDLVACPKP